MAWVLTPMQVNHRNQLNTRFPHRSKTSDGSIGDYQHSLGTSGHNPDDTAEGNAEWDGDADRKQEVRAIDVDKDLNDPEVTMEMVVQHYIKMFRAGRWSPFRYIIYKGRIWRKSNGWVTETYTGSNKHTEHAHFSGDYSDTADEASDYDFRLKELGTVALTNDEMNSIADKVVDKMFDAYVNKDGVFRAPSDRTEQANTHWPFESVVTTMMDKMVSTRTAVSNVQTSLGNVASAITSVGNAVNTVLGKVTQDDGEVAQARDQLTNELAALRADLMSANAALTAGVANVDEEVIAKLANPQTPDEQVAEVLSQLLGDRKNAVVALMQD